MRNIKPFQMSFKLSKDSDGLLVIDESCIMNAVADAYSQMEDDDHDGRWTNPRTTAMYMRRHIENALVHYSQESGSFPAPLSLEAALNLVGHQLGSGSVANPYFGFCIAQRQIMRKYGALCGSNVSNAVKTSAAKTRRQSQSGTVGESVF